jgi:hypothetical protein
MCLKFLSEKGAELPSPLFKSVKFLLFSSLASDSAIIDILPLFPNISTLRISHNRHNPPKEFGQLLMEKLTSTSSGEDVLLPKLSVLAWGNGSARVCLEEKHVTQSIYRLLQARKKNQLPLESVKTFVVKNPKDQGGKQLQFTKDSIPVMGTSPLLVVLDIL